MILAYAEVYSFLPVLPTFRLMTACLTTLTEVNGDASNPILYASAATLPSIRRLAGQSCG